MDIESLAIGYFAFRKKLLFRRKNTSQSADAIHPPANKWGEGGCLLWTHSVNCSRVGQIRPRTNKIIFIPDLSLESNSVHISDWSIWYEFVLSLFLLSSTFTFIGFCAFCTKNLSPHPHIFTFYWLFFARKPLLCCFLSIFLF